MLKRGIQNEAQERLEALLIEGLESGPGIQVTDEYIKQRRQKLLSKFPQLQTETIKLETEVAESDQ